MEAAHGEMLNVARKIYVTEWAGNAQVYQKQGIYGVLAAELVEHGKIRRLLDVGCGLGHGLAAVRDLLSASGPDLIGIDENGECLAIAAKRLNVPENVAANLSRLKSTVLPDGRYRIVPGQETIAHQKPATLVQVNILLRDDAFFSWLASEGPLDAITLWFVGIHKALSAMEIASAFEIKSDADHRERVEDAVLNLAKLYLRPGGILQIVARGGFPDDSRARATFADAFIPLLEDSALDPISITPYRYDEPVDDRSIRVRSLNASVNGLPNYAVSVVAVRKA